jgi:hypothetical protein
MSSFYTTERQFSGINHRFGLGPEYEHGKAKTSSLLSSRPSKPKIKTQFSCGDKIPEAAFIA